MAGTAPMATVVQAPDGSLVYSTTTGQVRKK